MIKKITIPSGIPNKLPSVNLLKSWKSTSLLIFHIKAKEIIKDKIILIWIASCGRNKYNKKGVAIMEKPKPVLVCRIDATKIITIKINKASKESPPSSNVVSKSF